MDAGPLLNARIAAALADLARVRELLAGGALKGLAGAGKSIAARLRDRVAADFRSEIDAREKELQRDLEDAGNPKTNPADCWTAFAVHERDWRALAADCMAFIYGVLARATQVEDELCVIADALLDELSGAGHIAWKRFTIFGEGESYTHNTAIIRLRFPLANIWNLPVAAHEFGHFLANWLPGTDADGSQYLAFQRHLKTCAPDPRSYEWACRNEYFADAFGTFALGPAYACTCLLLRFQPQPPGQVPDARHPPFARRAYLVLKLLRRSLKSTATGYGGVADYLEKAWSASLQGAGYPALSPADAGPMDELAYELYEMLAEGAAEMEYRGWPAALALRTALQDSTAGWKHTPRIADVVNAAWRCRIDRPAAQWQAIDTSARRICSLAAQEHNGGHSCTT